MEGYCRLFLPRCTVWPGAFTMTRPFMEEVREAICRILIFFWNSEGALFFCLIS